MHRSGRRKKMDTRTNFVKVKLVNPGHTVTTVFRPYIAWERGLPAYFSFLKSTGIAFTKDIIGCCFLKKLYNLVFLQKKLFKYVVDFMRQF